MTSRIRTLPRGVVDVIAAGEVVERPASVVKELVENALDAGARRVAVTIADGGRTLIRVTDDGAGMGPEDLALAFAPHATSKIRAVEDLEAVATYGFRGEALASIGAVADASIETGGHRIEDRRGDLGPVAPAPATRGTTVEVRSLFAAIPARRKFLRAPATEASKVTEVVHRLALHRPDVAFLLDVDGREVLRAPAGEAPRDRATRILGGDRAGHLLPVDREEGGVRVEGFVASPDAAERGRPPQFLSVNGRSVLDRTVAHAVRAGLEGLVLVHRQPAWALSVTLDPSEVDVNVHPAKSEVRFRRPSAVHAAVEAAVREAVLAGERPPGIPAAALEGRTGVREALDAFLGGAAPAPPLPARAEIPFEAPAPGQRFEVLQVRDTFLVYEAPDGIRIVDQHALHERVLLERLRARAAGGAVEVQRLLVPEVLECGVEAAGRAEEGADLLRRAGLLVERFGSGAVAVHGVPRALSSRPVRRVAEAALRDLEETHGHGLLETMACHGAVRAGDPLRPEEARALLAEGEGLVAGGHCAHGRPTELRLTFADLEKRFGRR